MSQLMSPALGLNEILAWACEMEASDVHIAPGENIYFRIQGELGRTGEKFGHAADVVTSEQTQMFASEILNQEELQRLGNRGACDGALTLEGTHRFRFNAFLKSGEVCFAFRRLQNQIPTLEELGLDNQLYDVCRRKDGLVLLVGPTGSGKSTTLAAMIDWINSNRSCHIITLEDPVEYVHTSKNSLVNQRQVGRDVDSFHLAMKDALRQDPDVILVGEMRDSATIQMAVQAGLTGHLVLATLHAGDCQSAIERLVGAYTEEQGEQLVVGALTTVVAQHLVPRQENPNSHLADHVGEPRVGGKRVLASEVVHVNHAIANLIRNRDFKQIRSIVESSRDAGMWTLDACLAKLLRTRQISPRSAQSLARNPELMSQLALKQRGR